MWSPSLAVARLAVDILVRTITGDDRVQRLGAIVALVALAMPISALRNHQLSGKDRSTAPGTTCARLRLDTRRVRDDRFRSH